MELIYGIVLWVLFMVLAVNFVWVTSLNLWITVRWYIWHRPGSRVPLAGGLLGVFALLIGSPLLTGSFDLFECYWWIPFVLDLGSVPLVLHTIFFLLWRKIRGGKHMHDDHVKSIHSGEGDKQ
jgi:hypothetical protein